MLRISLAILIGILLWLQVDATIFSQFTSTTTNCSTNEIDSCFDMVFLLDTDTSLNTDITRLLQLANQLPITTDNCVNRYGITAFGVVKAFTRIQLNGTSYFGTPAQLNTAVLNIGNLPSGNAATSVASFEAINSVIDNYVFRDGVRRDIVLISHKALNGTSSSTQHSYPNTLLSLLQNRITLSVITTGVQYYSDITDSNRLIGMKFNSKVGLGKFSDTSCSTNLDITTEPRYSIQTGYEMNYRSYVELAWNTNGSSYDLNYFDSQTTTYCVNYATQAFTYGTLQSTICIPQGNAYTYSSETVNSYHTVWTDVNPTRKTSCVDMVFLLDRTGSMNSFYSSIQNLSSLLPEYGSSCNNRYGLTLFHDVIEIVNFSSSIWGTPTELYNEFGFSRTGYNEDGYLGINHILSSYTFRSSAQKHIILFTDEPRTVIDSSLTKSSIETLLKYHDVIFSVMSEASDYISYINSFDVKYLQAVTLYETTLIGFTTSSSGVEVYTPAHASGTTSDEYVNYIEVAWGTGGVAFNLDYYTSTIYYSTNSDIFNTVMFSYGNSVDEYSLISIGATAVGVRDRIPHYTFSCTTNKLSNTSISLVLNGMWHTVADSASISVTTGLWDTTPGEYNFICVANNSNVGGSWLGTFTVYDIPSSPFTTFSPNYVQDNDEITCDSFEVSSCADVVVIVDFNIFSKTTSLARIAEMIGNITQSNCTNRYGLTVYGSTNGVSIVTVTTASQFGTATELQNILNVNLISGSVSTPSDAYEAMATAIETYQFRNDVDKKIVLITDRSQPVASSYRQEDILQSILLNDIILSVITDADMFTSTSQERLIGMSGSNRIGYGNYSHCSSTVTGTIDTVFDTQNAVNKVTIHNDYVVLAWTTGGASYDLRYFELSPTLFCSDVITNVFSYATLAETPCKYNGQIYSYSDRSAFSTYTEWNDVIPQSHSSCVDMVFLVDQTGSMNRYYSAIENLASNLPNNGETCQNLFGLTIFHNNAVRQTVGSSTSYWGTPSELYTALNSFSTTGVDEDGWLAIDYVIDEYTFRSDVVKHIVYFGDEARTILDSSITNTSLLTKLASSGIVLSVVTDGDKFYSLSSTTDPLLAGVLLSNTLIGFTVNQTRIDTYSPSTFSISDNDVHTNYIELAWTTGGLAFDLSFFSGSSYYTETSSTFNALMFSYDSDSNFSIPYVYKPVLIISMDVNTNRSVNYVEYIFSCETRPSPDLSISLFIDGLWYTNNGPTSSISVVLSLSHLSPGEYNYLCLANSSLGIDADIAEYTTIEIPIYPFQQFAPDYNSSDVISCGAFVQTECVDVIFILSMTQLTTVDMSRIVELTPLLPDTINSCQNRFGLTLYGLSTGSMIVNVSSTSVFGTAQQLRTAVEQNQNIVGTIGAGAEDGYIGINNAIEKYTFRDGVKKRILLFTNEEREIIQSSSQYNYENTLLSLLKNNISLSVVSNGAVYATDSTQDSLVGIIYNNRIGFGVYNETSCTNDLDPVQDARYSIMNRDIYVSYNELAWSTGGAGFDITYLTSSTYCQELLLQAFTFALFSDATCDFYSNAFTYESLTFESTYTNWTDVNPQSFSNCVDMVFILDRTGSMDKYYQSIGSIFNNLPTNGESCINRYGLTLFEDYSIALYIGGGTNLFGTPTQLASGLTFTQTGVDEDGLLAINYVIDTYQSSFRDDAQKHIVLLTDEPRTIVSSTVTKLSVLNRLNDAGIILSVATTADDFYYIIDSTNIYVYAAIEISNTVIGFGSWDSLTEDIDAISPVNLNTLNSNAEENYVELAWETGGVAFDMYFYDDSQYDTRSSAVFNKLMFSWGGRPNSSIAATYAPVLVSALNSSMISSSTGELVYNFACISTSTLNSNLSLLVDGNWYTSTDTSSIEQVVVFDYPYPHPGSYDFLCVANSSIGGDQTLGEYTVPDTPRVYPQYSQFLYIPDTHIECDAVPLQKSHCVDIVVVIDLSAFVDTVFDRISSFTSSLPANSSNCLNRYGLTLYGTSSLSQIIQLTNSATQSYFSTPSDLNSAIQHQRTIASTLGTGSRDGYEAIHSIIEHYPFRDDVQKKIILFSNGAREVAPSFKNLTFISTVQTLLQNKITLNTISSADEFYYFYNNIDNRLIGMHYNTRTGVGSYSSTCTHSLDNLASIPSVEFTIINDEEHTDYVELAWRTNGTSFDLSYFEQSSGYCPDLVDATILYAVIQNYPCILDIVDYAFTSRSQSSNYTIWENILPQVTPACLDMVFLFDSSVLSTSYFNTIYNLITKLNNIQDTCNHIYTAYSYTYAYEAIDYIIYNHNFETDYIKSIFVITDQERTILDSRFTKFSTLTSLRLNGVILSVITNASTFYYNTQSPVNFLAAVRISNSLIGFRSYGTDNIIMDAVSTVSHNISDTHVYDDFIDIAWLTGGVAFDISLVTEDVTPFETLMFIWGTPVPIEITSMSMTSLGALNDPGPYQFTCSINNAPHANLTLVIEGVSYVATDTTSITKVVSLSQLTSGTYQFLCIASNSNGGDTQTSQFTIKEPIPSPFFQFAFKPDSGQSCNQFEVTNCVDLIFILDISGSINNELNRIAELASNLPQNAGTCENRYGLVLFALQTPTVMNMSAGSIYGTPSQLESQISNSKNIGNTLGYGPEDGYHAIHLAIDAYPFREGVERRLVVFADQPRTATNTTEYTYENTVSLLFQNKIKLSAFTYSGEIYYYTRETSTLLIGMNYFLNIGFGDMSSSDTDINVVPNPYYNINNDISYESYVNLAFDTFGSAFDMQYMRSDITPYSPALITKLFEFAVIQDASCKLDDVTFNFDSRILTSSSILYSRWKEIIPQIQSNCVDMVFLVDRTSSFSSSFPGVLTIANNLPENGDGCANRYGLVTFERTAVIYNIGVTTKFGTVNQLYDQLSSFSYSGGTEDGYVGIDAIIDEFDFRESENIRKHIILFTDEPRSIVNSSLTYSSILQSLGDNDVILTVATNADSFYKLGTTSGLYAATLVSGSYVGFLPNGDTQKVDAYSPINVTFESSFQHDSYVALAWESGGLAFDLTYFTDVAYYERSVVTLFNRLMYSWGTPLTFSLTSSSSEENNQLTIECTTNNVSNPAISLIIGDKRYTETSSNVLRTSLSEWNLTSYSYICIANNSVGGASLIQPLDIQVPSGPPTDASLKVLSSTSMLVAWDHSTGSSIVVISYRVVYRGSLFDTELQYTVTTTNTSITLYNLHPYTLYSVQIVAVTASSTNQTDILTAVTFQDAPTESPQSVTATTVSSTTILIHMYPPSAIHQNGPIRNYTVYYTQGNGVITSFIHFDDTETYPLDISSQISVSSLLPYTEYTFTIIATNDGGSSPSVTVTARTDPAAPSEPPQNITAHSNNPTTVTLSIYPPSSYHQNGIITSYRVSIQGTPFDSSLQEFSLPISSPVYPLSSTTTHVLSQLHAYNTYAISVVAINSVGKSAASSPVSITTLQSAPAEAPQNVTAVPTSPTVILFTCYPPSPSLQNGLIRNFILVYYSEWNPDTIESETILVDTTEPYPTMLQHQIVLSSLQPYTEYTFTIIAVNDAGNSPGTTLTTRTPITAPTESPQSVTATTVSSTTILIHMYPPSAIHQNGPIRNYTVSYTQGNGVITSFIHFDDTKTYPLDISSQISVSSLLPYTEYTFTIIATNDGGSSPSVTVMDTTQQAAPAEAPQNVTAVPTSPTVILFTCYPPSPSLQNGPIHNFTLVYYSEWNPDTIESETISVDTTEPYPTMSQHQIVLSSLQPYTEYTFTIVAINDAGQSPNTTTTVRTHTSAPTESPHSVTATTVSSTTILIHMYPPSAIHQNGPIRNYTVYYTQGSEVITSFIHFDDTETYPLDISSQISVSSLLPYTEYTFTIIATNDGGSSPSVTVMNTTNPSDASPIISYPHTLTEITPELSLSYQQEVTCVATGYPPPTVLWYDSDNDVVTTGDTLLLQTTNVYDGAVYTCKAENIFGGDAGSILISIDITDISVTDIFDNIDDNFGNPSGFDPEQVDDIAVLVSNILPNISSIPISEINDTKDTLAKGADTIEMLFDVISDNGTAISLDDAGTIVNTAGDIINKDTELEDISDNPSLSPEAIQQGGIAYASDALIIALRTIEKVCHNLGLNHFENPLVRDTFTVKSEYVDIYGANIPITNQLSDETFPLDEDIEDNVLIPKEVLRDLAGDEPSAKVVIANVGLYGAVHESSTEGTGPKQDSRIMIVVIPGRNGTVSLVENGTIIFNSALSDTSTDKIGTFLLGNLWTTSGITTVVNSDTNTTLMVDHFTSFVIFATHPPSVDSSIEFYLSIASYAISTVSILCLICSLFLFIFAGKKGFFRIEINILYFNLCIALLISTILFLLYGLDPDVLGVGELLCKIMAAIIHYSWLVVFTWCLAFAIYIAYKVKFGIKRNKKIYPYIIIFAWVFPIVFPVVTLGIRLNVYVDVTKHCFPSITDYVLMGLLGPILAIAVVAILMVIFLTFAFVLVNKKLENDVIRDDIKHIILSTAVLTCILVVPWLALAVFVFIDNSLIEWTYVLLNDTMGIFFFIFVALRVKEVRYLLLCRSPPNTDEDVIRRNAFQNPIYDGNIQTAPDESIYDEVQKSGANLTYEAMEKRSFGEKGEMSKEGRNYYNPYEMQPSTSSYSAQIYEGELPPVYDQVASRKPEPGFMNPTYDVFRPDSVYETSFEGLTNPFYQTTTVQGHVELDGIYQELNFIGEDVPSPLHPTGTKMDKEHPQDI